MKNLVTIGLISFLIISELPGQVVSEIDRDELLSLTGMSNDTTYVVNFWATWCSPCVKEIGYFEELHREYGGATFKVILVSLDFPNQVESRVVPFLYNREITAGVRIMTDMDYDSWIDQVDPSWTGAIPATLIYNKDRRVFLEKELTKNELYEHVHQILN